MKLKNIITNEDVIEYVEGCLNDFETGVSTKEETIGNMVDLIVFAVEKDRIKRGDKKEGVL